MDEERKFAEYVTKYPLYDPNDPKYGFGKSVYEGTKLRFEIQADGDLLIEGNRMGLLSLAETLITLTQPSTGLGYHVHLAPGFDYPGEGPGFVLQLNEDGKHGDH
jgi:hypothetical protein